ncbi:MAG: MIP/aquaporin family protein [Bacteroidota bacterium]
MNVYVAEFIGTSILLLMGGGVVANVNLNKTIGQGSGWMVVTTAWALAVFLGVVVAGPYSGAHLNPAVTLGLAVAGSFKWALVPGYILAQMGGAMMGAFLVWLMYKDHFDATEDEGLRLSVFATGPAIPNPFRNLISEIMGTFVLVFVIFYIAKGEFKLSSEPSATPIGLGSVGAIPVAFLVWAIGLSLGGTTGYAINPARDLGPRIFHALSPIKGNSNWSYAWIPVLGPIIGGVLAAGLYLLLG